MSARVLVAPTMAAYTPLPLTASAFKCLWAPARDLTATDALRISETLRKFFTQ